MSDITKKIFSIESEMSEPSISDVVTSIEAPKPAVKPDVTPPAPKAVVKPAADPVPDFITRPAADTPRMRMTAEAREPSRWVMWTGLTLTLIWIGASAIFLYNFFNISQSALTPMALTGVILAVFLPAILITLLWVSLRRLDRLSQDTQNLVIITEKLTHADETALVATQNLANGISAEIARVDASLSQTIDRFSTLQVQLVADTRSIDETGLMLTERSENVGQNLALQRQALESIAGTFDSKMESLSTTITRQSDDLTQATERAEKSITLAKAALTESTEAAKQSGQSIGGELLKAAETLTSGQSQITDMNTQLSDMISRLQTEQSKLQSEMNAQVKGIRDATETATEQSKALMGSLRTGQDTVAALNTASMTTNKRLTQQFADMGEQISAAQIQANEISEKAANRVQESLAETRKDISRIETDMLSLQAKLRNARSDSESLDLDLTKPEDAQAKGFGRLKLKPLETDFPPVEPPRFTSTERKPELFETQDTPLPLDNPLPDAPLNLGADMTMGSPDDEITQFDPDVLRRPAADPSPNRGKSKGFGRAKSKQKNGWHWRDMLGGLEQPGSASLDIAGTDPQNKTTYIIDDLRRFDLSPTAIVDDGTIIEASNAFTHHGYGALQTCVATRLSSPVQHLQDKLRDDPASNYKFREFLSQYSSQISAHDNDPTSLRNEFGTPAGRAFLLAAAALRG